VNERILLTTAPITHFPGVQAMAALGPVPHLSGPRRGSVLVGNRKVGPMPAIRFGLRLALRKKVGLKLPTPRLVSSP
jgi:hypothetical protein